MKDRIFKNPITSLLGLVLIGLGVTVLTMTTVEESTKLTVSTLLITAGLVALGLKDPKVNE